jgi:hypothetical protein
LETKSGKTISYISSFFISLGSIGTIIGIIQALGLLPLKDIGIPGIIIIIQFCTIIAYPITIIKNGENIGSIPRNFKALKKSGLVNAYRIKVQNSQREERIKELVKIEHEKVGQSCFRLIASSGFSYLHPAGIVWSHGLNKAISDGALYKIVLESPFSEHAYARALASRITRHHWNERVDLTHLREINEKGNVEIKVTSFPVNCSLFFTRENVFYDPYLWALPNHEDRVENHFWVFDFKKLEDESSKDYECYTHLEKHFDFLFEHAIPLNDFLGQNDKNYNRLTEEFPNRLNGLQRGGY